MTYLKVYLAALKISLLSFGGAYSIWALLDKELVRECPGDWTVNPDRIAVCRSGFNAVLAVAEILPGPQVNPISMLAHRSWGVMGMLAMVFALVTPGLVFIPLVHRLHNRLFQIHFFRLFFSGAMLATVAVLISFVLKLFASLMPDWSYPTILTAAMACAAFLASYRFRMHPVAIAVTSAALGYFFL